MIKKILVLFLFFGMVFWNCEESEEPLPEDCAGVAGGDNICGCTDSTAINYDSTATFDDGTCDTITVTQADIEAAIELVNEANVDLENIFTNLYDSDEPEDMDGIIDLLDFTNAYALYTEAQTLHPDNEDANFGVAVTGLMQVVQDQAFNDMIDQWDNYFSNTTLFEADTSNTRVLGRQGFGLPLNADGMRIPITPFLDMPLRMARMSLDYVPQFSELQNIIRDIMLPYIDAGIAGLEKVEANPDYIFTITSAMQPDVGSSSMELDLTEVYTIDMMLHAIKAIANTIIAHNFDFATHDGAGIVAELNLGSDFGTINSTGEAGLSAAYAAMQSAITKLNNAIDFLEDESDDQDNDVIAQMENYSDYQDMRDALDEANEMITQPTWVTYNENNSYGYYGDYSGTGNYYDYNYEEDSVRVDISKFYTNPFQDLKEMVPPYVVTEGIDYDWDWDWYSIDDFHESNDYDSVSFTITVDSNSYFYFEYWSTMDPMGNVDTSMYGNIGVPQEVIDAIDQKRDSLASVYNGYMIETSADWGGYLGDNQKVGIRWYIYEAEFDGASSYPIITWDADNYEDWKNGWPDPTFNGIVPDWTVDDLLEFLDLDDEDDWEKVWD